MKERRSPSSLAYLAVSAVIAMVAGCGSNEVTLKTEEIRSVAVKTVAVSKEEVPQKTIQPASVHAYYRAEIRANASGYVRKLNSDIGEVVKAGDVLAEIDVPELEMQHKVIEARVERFVAEEQQAEALIELAEASVKSATAKVAQSKSMVAGTEASLAAADAEFQRTEDMVARGSLQNRMLDEVRQKRDAQSANKEAVESSTDSAQAEVEVAKAKKRSAEADLKAAKAATKIVERQLEELEVLIEYGTVKAPFAGIVTARNLEPGDLVRSSNEVGSGKPLFVISQIDKVRIRIPVPENDAAMVNPGDEIALTFPSFKDEPPMSATVTRTSGSLDPATRTMMIEAEMPNPDRKLMPGMFGQALIKMESRLAANVLPARAIRFDESGKAHVYVVGDDDKVTIAEVATGLDNGNKIEVLSGVEPGQRVIDSHLKRFTDGQQVTVLN